ncbi:MAG: protease complex subunit PrcB family protein [Elusimicrobia bacterium]|nr:protease complex subunit PrcB family protein [Elusimicrobiota bacterium]
MDEELPEEQKRQVEGHLPLCRDCSRHYQELKAASKLIQSLPEAALPAQFTRRLQNPIEKFAEPGGWNWNPFAPIRMISVAACGLAAWAVVLLMAPSPENSLPPSKNTLVVIHGLSKNAVSGTVSSQRIAAPKASAPAAAFAELKNDESADGLSRGAAAPFAGLRGPGSAGGAAAQTLAESGRPQAEAEESMSPKPKYVDMAGERIGAGSPSRAQRWRTAAESDLQGPPPSAASPQTFSAQANFNKSKLASSEVKADAKAAFAPPPSIQSARAKDQPIEWRHIFGGFPEPAQFVVRDSKKWQDLWTKMGNEKAPEIDFSSTMAVVVFMGEKNSGGYTTEILDAKAEGDRLIVRYRENTPAPGLFVVMALTQPYHIKLFPRSDKTVVFEKVK